MLLGASATLGAPASCTSGAGKARSWDAKHGPAGRGAHVRMDFRWKACPNGAEICGQARTDDLRLRPYDSIARELVQPTPSRRASRAQTRHSAKVEPLRRVIR